MGVWCGDQQPDSPLSATGPDDVDVGRSYSDYSRYIEQGGKLVKHKKSKNNFPARLHRLLSEQNCNVVVWLPHGRAWKILNEERFMALLAISQEFQIKRYDSFTRQLSGWGFRRLDKGSYYHQCFLRGIPEITCLIRRIPSGGGRMSREGKPPDFDAISREFPVGGATLAEEVPSDSNIVNLDSTPSITRPSDANIVLDSIPSITRAGEVREAALRHETSYGISNGRELPSSGHSMGNAWPALWSILAEEPQVLSSILAEDPQVLSGVLAEDPQVLSGVLAEEPQVLSSIQQLDPHNNMQQHQACRLPTHRLGLGHTSPQYQDVMHSGLPGVPMPDELADQQLELQDMQQHQAQGPPIHQLGLRSTSPQYQDTVMHSGLPGIPMPGELANDLLLYYQNLDYQGTNEGGF